MATFASRPSCQSRACHRLLSAIVGAISRLWARRGGRTDPNQTTRQYSVPGTQSRVFYAPINEGANN